MLPQELISSVFDTLGRREGTVVNIRQTVSLGGGCINEACRLETDKGTFFIKYNLASRFPQMFEREAWGLKLLECVNAIRIPGVVHTGIAGKFAYLLLEHITSAPKKAGFWEDFGCSLARLHTNTNKVFGLDYDNYIGSLPQSNTTHHEWTDFFIRQRLEPQLKAARDAGEANHQLTRQFEILFGKLENLIPVENPALLHGDLWNGNFLVDEYGSSVLIDPAIYYGHREVDLAMTRLFGGFPGFFYESYSETFPLENGWEVRIDLFNLYPLLVHVNLFGGGYISDVKRIVSRFA